MAKHCILLIKIKPDYLLCHNSMSNKKLILIFLPLLLLAGLALFIRIIQYEPLFPNIKKTDTSQTLQVPIFPDDPITGDKKSPVTLIAFEDFACENCKTQSELLGKILEQYPQALKIVWKLMPITRFPIDSTLAAKYGYCANQEGKFEAFKAYAFENGDNLSQAILDNIAEQVPLDQTKLKACLESPAPQIYIDTTKNLATLLQIQALPTMFLSNKQIQPPTTLEGWKTLLGI